MSKECFHQYLGCWCYCFNISNSLTVTKGCLWAEALLQPTRASKLKAQCMLCLPI